MSSEKQPLIEQQPSTLAELERDVVTARQDFLNANRAYHEAWKQTLSGRRINRCNNIILAIISLFGTCMIGGMLLLLGYAMLIDDPSMLAPRRVPLEAHIMSKCPDTQDCLRDLVLPVMQEVSPYVDFELSYIGNATAEDDSVSCMHGPSECLGDILELCAAEIHPDPKIYLGFTMCLTREFEDIPHEDLVRACALEHRVDFDTLNECASRDDGSFGMDMLRNSFERSAAAHVDKSCTIRLDGEIRCIRDAGEWVDCDGLDKSGKLIDEIMRLRNVHADD